MANTTEVSFALRKITTEQFAMLNDQLGETNEINIQTNIRFGADNEHQQIAVFAGFTFENNGQPFLIIEAGCHFAIEPKAWSTMLKNEKKLLVTAGLLQHLSVLTVGTTRGILHAKTENTPFNRFFLPTINVAELIEGDVSFEFSE